jgi:hypothetical protein
MEDKKEVKTKEEYIKDFEKLHEDFMSGKGEFISDDYTPLRTKKIKKAKTKRCKCKK